jgi:hypothetical protein
MFDYYPPEEPPDPVDYTGLKIGGILAPVFFLITFLSNADMALTVCIVLGLVMFAIKLRWNLRKHVWFWATIAFVMALHVPLFFIAHWSQGNVPTIAYTLPFGIADFLIMLGAIGLAERLFQRPKE